MSSKIKDLGDITEKIYDKYEVKINGSSKFEERYKINYEGKEHIIRIMKYDIFILILDEIKGYFKIPYTTKLKAYINGLPVLVSLYRNEININKFNSNDIHEVYGPLNIKSLKNSASFMNEIRRLFAFRFIMCLSSNTECKIDVIVKKLNNKLFMNNILDTNTYLPICIRESSYLNSSNFSDKIIKADSTNIPLTVIEKWFEGSKEIAYETIQNLLFGTDFTKFKMMLVDIIQKYIKDVREEYHCDKTTDKLRKVRDVESLIWWANAVSERMRNF
jgi:hypothetical protein